MTKGRKPQAGAVRRPQTDSHLAQSEARAVAGVSMPADIAANEQQANIWHLLVPDVNRFTEQDIPNLRLLVFWHGVAEQAQASLTRGDGSLQLVRPVAMSNVYDTNGKQVPIVQKSPAITILKEASAEIRALSDILGLSPLARSRIGLLDATTVKTAADTAKMFQSIDAAYTLPASNVEVVDATK